MTNLLIACYLYDIEPGQFQRSLDSLMNQDIRDYLVYIFDDNSTKWKEENIKYIMEKYGADKRIKLVSNSKHVGEALAYLYLIDTSESTYIAIHNFNTIVEYKKLSLQLNNIADYDCIVNQLKDLNTGFIYPNNWENDHLVNKNDRNAFFFDSSMFTRELYENVKIGFSKEFQNDFKHLLQYLMITRGNVYFNKQIVGTTKYEDHSKAEDMFKIQNILNNDKDRGDLTCIVLCDENWNGYFEKVLLLLRLKANNVKILVIDKTHSDDFKHICSLYACEYISSSNNIIYNIELGINNCTTENFLLIPSPCCFSENFDIYINRYLTQNSNQILTPYTNDLIGYTFRLLDLDVNKPMKYFYNNFNGQLTDIDKVPVMNNIVFATTKYFFEKINSVIGITSLSYMNDFISLKAWLCEGECNVLKNVKCTIYNDLMEKNKSDVLSSSYDLWFIYNMFLNETLHIHKQLLKEKLEKQFNIIEKLYENNKEINATIKQNIFNFPRTLSWFLENINSFYYYV